MITASIKVLGKTYSAQGDTVFHAIANLEVPKAKGVSILSLSKGDNRRERVLPAVATARLFSPSKLVREIALKNMSFRFDV